MPDHDHSGTVGPPTSCEHSPRPYMLLTSMPHQAEALQQTACCRHTAHTDLALPVTRVIAVISYHTGAYWSQIQRPLPWLGSSLQVHGPCCNVLAKFEALISQKDA